MYEEIYLPSWYDIVNEMFTSFVDFLIPEDVFNVYIRCLPALEMEEDILDHF